MAIPDGTRFNLHVRSGEVRGPYTIAECIAQAGGGFTAYYRLERDGTERPAYASEKWLREGLRGGVGWKAA